MFHSISITPCNIDVMVIVILGEEGMGYSPFIRELADRHVAHVLAMAPGSVCHEQKNLAALIEWYMTTHTHIHLVSVHENITENLYFPSLHFTRLLW